MTDPKDINSANLPPPRFVMAVANPLDQTPVWCVAVRAADVERVRQLRAAVKFDRDVVLEWFQPHYSPPKDAQFEYFLQAIRSVMVTQHQPKFSMEAKEVTAAIDVILRILPKFIDRRLVNPGPLYTFDELARLLQLAEAAREAAGIIKAQHSTDLKWHYDALLFEWHVRGLLKEAGMPKAQSDKPVALVNRIVSKALEFTRPKEFHEPTAVGWALKNNQFGRQTIRNAGISCPEEVRRLGYAVVA